MPSQQSKRLEKISQTIAGMKDPVARLGAARSAREHFELLELEQVRRLRREGSTWSQIGELYGLTKQGAQQRFKARLDKLKD